MYQLLDAMEYMHRCWYIHRDLKTSNILYNTQGKLSVCDFGLARKYGDPIKPYSPSNTIVTLWYRSPELLLGTKCYDASLDVWSIGCIFAEILTGDTIFEGSGELDQLQKIFSILGRPTTEKWPGYQDLAHAKELKWKGDMKPRLATYFPRAKNSFTQGNSLSDAGYDLISRMLQMDPTQRISASEALNHPYFRESPVAVSERQMPIFGEGGRPM